MGLTKQQLIKEIENKVSHYLVWTIGIAEQQVKRRKEHENHSVWHQWEAESEKTAREVEKYFIDKGMKGGTVGGDHPNWVYIFVYYGVGNPFNTFIGVFWDLNTISLIW